MKKYIGYIQGTELSKERYKALGLKRVTGKLSVDLSTNTFYLEVHRGETLVEKFMDYDLEYTTSMTYEESVVVRKILDHKYPDGSSKCMATPTLSDIWMARIGNIKQSVI